LLHLIYSHVARARRRYYTQRPHLRRRLSAPVISIGNLTVGGSGKTPLSAEIARMMIAMGERPAILSRGYARRVPSDGVVLVSDGIRMVSDVEHAGDEPFMLAQMVPRAAVLVSSSRYLAGKIAESRLGCTVHILDDGFQHFDLMRDVDLLVMPAILDDVRTLPAGRYREPLDAALAADAFLVEGTAGPTDPCGLQADSPTFEFARRLAGTPSKQPAFAFAGIARPQRFHEDLQHAGWNITGHRWFRDHHHYSRRDVETVARAARASGAEVMVTTAKDAVRLPRGGGGTPVLIAPMETVIEPRFREWLAARLSGARSA
jgi:tetraacyldisaccharide 4'-kinase